MHFPCSEASTSSKDTLSLSTLLFYLLGIWGSTEMRRFRNENFFLHFHFQREYSQPTTSLFLESLFFLKFSGHLWMEIFSPIEHLFFAKAKI